jgi:hypothetical protein
MTHRQPAAENERIFDFREAIANSDRASTGEFDF